MTPRWLESVYSDGSRFFVSRPQPELGETVTVWLRMYEDAPVEHVYLRRLRNGEQHIVEMERHRVERGLAWYGAEVTVNEPRVEYQFYLACGDRMYYYDQRGISTSLPDQTGDFVLLAGYRQPSWVKGGVFYQIFPERFRDGDQANNVRDGEYTSGGYPTIQVKDWNTPPAHYDQSHCLDFYGGDLDGIVEKIPYLKDLGVTALYLNPIFTAPSVHKYDCIDYFHVDPHFGGDEALARLSKALHENGMRLILDISINHTGSDHRWFNRDGVWFDASEGACHHPEREERGYYFFDGQGGYRGWAGLESMPTLNYTSQALRRRIYAASDSVLRKWLKPPYSIDGWRFDVADVFGRGDALQLDRELWPEIRRAIREENPDAYILAEHWGDCATYLQGREWDSAMNYFGCARVLRQFAGQSDLYLARDPVLRAASRGITAQEVRARITAHLAKLPFVIQENQFNLLDSHDVSRLHNDPAVHPGDCRGVVIAQFMLLGTPSIYYGDEAGIGGGICTNEECRYPMPWDSGFEDSDTFRLYRTLAGLKTSRPAMAEGGMKFLYAQDGVLALARFTDREALVAVVSVREDQAQVELALDVLGAQAPEGAVDLLGSPLHYSVAAPGQVELTVPAHGAVLFACRMK